MTKLAQLLAELCPNGVEYKYIKDIAILSAGGDVPKDNFSKYKTDQYQVPIFSNGTGDNALYGYTSEAKILEPCVTISARGTIGYSQFRDTPFYPIIRLIVAIPKDCINAKFLNYYIQTIKFIIPKSGIPQLTIPMFSSYKVPVPPLPVQQEIVRILDKFTELSHELSHELTLRKKQYQYYRDAFLNFEDPSPYLKKLLEEFCHDTIEYKQLSEVCLSLKKSALKQKELIASGKYPVINSSRNYYGYYNDYNNEGDAVCIASHGEYAGFATYIKDKFWAGALCYPYRSLDNCLLMTKFLFYYLKFQEKHIMKKLVFRGGIPYINKKDLDKYPIPVPPLSVQERIVAILDRFDTLCTSLTEGLPAEIAARKKQYEYYRDKLLTFKEIKTDNNL